MADEKILINNAEEIIPPVNDSPYKRILAIGDIHGQFKALKSLWKKLNVSEDDLVIFLGDYVDRGEGVGEVLEWVINQSARKNFVFLRGNHEQMMINALKDTGADRITWIINGGKATIFALRELIGKKIFTLNEILNFVDNLPLSYSITVSGQKYFFCHAGVEDGVALDKQSEEFLLWSREEFFNGYNGDDVIISGHSPIKLFFDFDNTNPRPIKIPNKNIVMVDTGAFIPGGRLSAVDILSGQYWQNGEDRQGDVIFVCAGNTCRSPMAKYIMRNFLRTARLDKKILIDSAGCFTSGGDFMSNGAHEVLADNGIDFDCHLSKTFTEREYQNFRRVVALDSVVMKKAVAISHGDPDKKIRLLNVEDPAFDGDFRRAYKEIYRGCQELFNELAQ